MEQRRSRLGGRKHGGVGSPSGQVSARDDGKSLANVGVAAELPDSCQVVIVVLGHELQHVDEPHRRVVMARVPELLQVQQMPDIFLDPTTYSRASRLRPVGRDDVSARLDERRCPGVG